MAPHGFLQDPPALGNQLTEDAFLVSLLCRLLPAEALGEALPDLGGRCQRPSLAITGHAAPFLLHLPRSQLVHSNSKSVVPSCNVQSALGGRWPRQSSCWASRRSGRRPPCSRTQPGATAPTQVPSQQLWEGGGACWPAPLCNTAVGAMPSPACRCCRHPTDVMSGMPPRVPLPRCAVVTSSAWRELKAVSAREGLVAAAYERRHGAHSRVLQVAKLYCFGASSGGCWGWAVERPHIRFGVHLPGRQVATVGMG